MLVSHMMTHKPVFIHPETSVHDALSLMRKEKISRLPVLDIHHRLAGIVSEKDLLYASPSPATSLSIYEMGALLAKLEVAKVMKKKVITVTEETPIEDAVRLMADNDIGGLPVVRDRALVGIETETDILNMFTELFGTREKGLQATLILTAQNCLSKNREKDFLAYLHALDINNLHRINVYKSKNSVMSITSEDELSDFIAILKDIQMWNPGRASDTQHFIIILYTDGKKILLSCAAQECNSNIVHIYVINNSLNARYQSQKLFFWAKLNKIIECE